MDGACLSQPAFSSHTPFGSSCVGNGVTHNGMGLPLSITIQDNPPPCPAKCLNHFVKEQMNDYLKPELSLDLQMLKRF